MSLPARELSTEEQEQLPFEFINGTWQPQGNNLPDLVAATWNNNTVWARKPTGPWYFDQEGDPEVVPEDWAKYYPHLEQVTVTTIIIPNSQAPTKEKESDGTEINTVGNTITIFQYPLTLLNQAPKTQT